MSAAHTTKISAKPLEVIAFKHNRDVTGDNPDPNGAYTAAFHFNRKLSDREVEALRLTLRHPTVPGVTPGAPEFTVRGAWIQLGLVRDDFPANAIRDLVEQTLKPESIQP